MRVLRKLYYRLSPQNRLRVRRVLYYPHEILQSGRDPKIPPKGKIFTGAGDFEVLGKQQLAYLQNYTQLKPNMTVLDVGSGMGRTAFALSSYLDQDGAYYGFDAMPQGIAWCQSKYEDLDNFHFEHIEVYNNLYNQSEIKSTEVTFPYEAEFFDRAFLFSVFSHMLEDEIVHYLQEIYRVLKPGGQVLATFFTYDATVLERMQAGTTDMRFEVDRGDHWLMDETVSHANVAYAEDKLKSMIATANPKYKIEKVVQGFWSDFGMMAEGVDYQDIWVLSKPI